MSNRSSHSWEEAFDDHLFNLYLADIEYEEALQQQRRRNRVPGEFTPTFERTPTPSPPPTPTPSPSPPPSPPTTPEPRWVCTNPNHRHSAGNDQSIQTAPTPTPVYVDQGTQTPVRFTIDEPPLHSSSSSTTRHFLARPVDPSPFRQRSAPSPLPTIWHRSELVPPVTFLNPTLYYYGNTGRVIGRTSVTSARLFFDRDHGYLYEIHIRRRIDGHPHLLVDNTGRVVRDST
jgi:hypothetical protein